MASDALHQIIARCEGAYADKTLSGYRNDLLQFQRWCRDHGFEWLPAKPEAVADFIDDQAASKSIATVKRRVEAIKFLHRMADLPSPATNSEVLLALRRAGRAKRRRPKQALGLTADILDKMLGACPDTLSGLRNAALISVGYDTLCRSSELVAMRVEHLASDLSTIQVPRSKADPFGDGRIAHLSPATSVRVESWLDAAGLTAGPLFQGLHTARLSGVAFNTSSIRRLIKKAAEDAGLDPTAVEGLSGHSMRVGAAQDMMIAGIDVIGIMQAGGWRSFNVLGRYVENASAALMHQRRWEKLGAVATD